MPIQQITPSDAQKILQEDPNSIYVDVRSIPEFTQGHPEGAINIPLLHSQAGQMLPNPDFATVAASNLSKDKTLLVGCQVGGRSRGGSPACDPTAIDVAPPTRRMAGS